MFRPTELAGFPTNPVGNPSGNPDEHKFRIRDIRIGEYSMRHRRIGEELPEIV